MEGYDVITPDDDKVGHVVGVDDDMLIVEHGTLFKSRHAVPQTFAHTRDEERVVRVSISKQIIQDSPKLENGSFDRQAVAEHYGLAEASPASAPDAEGYGDTNPDDPGRSADEELLAQGHEPADQQRARIREEMGSGQSEGPSSPGLLGERRPD